MSGSLDPRVNDNPTLSLIVVRAVAVQLYGQ